MTTRPARVNFSQQELARLHNRRSLPPRGQTGLEFNLSRSDRETDTRTLWTQAGRLLSGSNGRVETSEVRSRDLQTVDSAGLSRSFTTSVE